MQKIQIPTCCPVCASKLELVNDQLFCRNSLCEAQVAGKLNHFAKTLKIKGLGPATLSKLNLESVLDIFYIDVEELSVAVGEKVASKLLQEIEKAKSADMATVIESFGVPLVGGTASAKIASVISDIDEISEEKCKEAGLGEKVTNNLLQWFETEYKEIKEFLPFSFDTKPQKLEQDDNKIVCITGKLKSFKDKAQATIALSEKGFTVVENLTKQVKFLIDETDKISTKRSKAESTGIPVITNLLEFLATY